VPPDELHPLTKGVAEREPNRFDTVSERGVKLFERAGGGLPGGGLLKAPAKESNTDIERV
jgi:hypothetical protein